MKFKKSLLCLLVTILCICQSGMIVFAAEKNESSHTTAKTTTSDKSKKSYTNAEVKLLACLIYTEAGNQSYKGKVAVGNVIMNRVKSSKFSHVKTVKQVIYDRKWSVQFGVTVGGSKSPLNKALNNYSKLKTKSNMKECIKAAKSALSGSKNVVGNRLYFTRYSKSLARSHKNYIKIGAHIFY